MFFSYIIFSESNPKKQYIGYTSGISQRLRAHNEDKCKSTSGYGPWKLKMFIAFPEKRKALDFEKYLKSGSGHAFAARHF